MKFHQTQTAKAILSNEEAVMLAHRLRDVSLHTPRLALALYQTATPSQIETVECLIQQVNHQLSSELSEEDSETLDYLMETTASIRGRGLLEDTRRPIAQRVVRVSRQANSQRSVLSVSAPDGGCVSRTRKSC